MTVHQAKILKMMLDGTGRLSAASFNDLCGSTKTVRAMFRDGLIEGDGVPAVYVEVSAKGREAFRKVRAETNL